jgi:hypothetical protein
LIRNEKPIVLFERHCHATEKKSERPLHVLGEAGQHSGGFERLETFVNVTISLLKIGQSLFSLRDTAMQLRSQRPLCVHGDAGHPSQHGGKP